MLNPDTEEDFRLTIIEDIENELITEQKRGRHRTDGLERVSRNRILNFRNTFLIILNFKTTIQNELNSYFTQLDKESFTIQKVTKSAFTQARSKIDFGLFKRLAILACDAFYRKCNYITWHGYRVLAVDGSRVVLPSHKTVQEEFGVHLMGPKADSKQCLGLISTLYDVFNLQTVDASIDKYTSSERDHLLNHLERVKEGDLLLLDRGYPCFWLLFLLEAKGIEFCVRLKDDWWNVVNDFLKEAEKEKIVTIKLPKKDFGKLKEYPASQDKELQIRLIKVELPNGGIEILCTSLLSFKDYPQEEFPALYHKRWTIEEDGYKMLKCRAELENWSGKTARSVKQDFFSKILLLNILSAYKHPIEEKVKAEFIVNEKRKHNQQLNKTSALNTLRKGLFSLFNEKSKSKIMEVMDLLIYKTREIIRPNRSLERKHKPKKQYYQAYKHY